MANEAKKCVHQQITDAMMEVLKSADHLVNEYTRKDNGHGTGVGMHAAEERLIRDVRLIGQDWPWGATRVAIKDHLENDRKSEWEALGQ